MVKLTAMQSISIAMDCNTVFNASPIYGCSTHSTARQSALTVADGRQGINTWTRLIGEIRIVGEQNRRMGRARAAVADASAAVQPLVKELRITVTAFLSGSVVNA